MPNGSYANLSDSTVLRNLGVAFGQWLPGYESCLRGLARTEVDPQALTPANYLGPAEDLALRC